MEKYFDILFFIPFPSQWKFWCPQFRTYIDCEGGDMELKRHLQEGGTYDAHTAQTPSEADHRNALRHAPPPPNRSSNASHSASGGSKRPLLLHLDDEEDDADVVVLKGKGKKAGKHDNNLKSTPVQSRRNEGTDNNVTFI